MPEVGPIGGIVERGLAVMGAGARRGGDKRETGRSRGEPVRGPGLLRSLNRNGSRGEPSGGVGRGSALRGERADATGAGCPGCRGSSCCVLAWLVCAPDEGPAFRVQVPGKQQRKLTDRRSCGRSSRSNGSEPGGTTTRTQRVLMQELPDPVFPRT